MSFGSANKFFRVGPFAKVEDAASAFSENLYFSFLFEESVKEQLKIQEKYEEALKDDDKDAISFTRSQMQLYENIFSLTMGHGLGELES